MAPADDESPWQARVTLRMFLRHLREDQGLKQGDVAEQAGIPVHQLGRIESGASTVRRNDLEKLLNVYGVTGKEQDEWIARSIRSRKRTEDWAGKYSPHIGNEFRQFLAIEAATKTVRNFEPFLVPGLLQTRRYARATLEVVIQPREADSDAEEPSPAAAEALEQKRTALLELRMERQRRWHGRQHPAEAYFMVDESVLLRRVGGAEVMLEQLAALRDAVAGGVVLHVLRHEAGLYEHWNEAYVIFEADLPVAGHNLFRENPHSDELVRESPSNAEPAEYLASFDLLRESAPVELTLPFLESLLSS